LRAKADGAEGHAGTGKQCFCCELHRALHFRAQRATEGRLLLLCLPTRSQEECALITAFKSGGDKSLGARLLILFCTRRPPDRSHAPRGNAAWDALRPRVTQSVTVCMPTRSAGTILRAVLNA
jgi:hypothetical protein